MARPVIRASSCVRAAAMPTGVGALLTRRTEGGAGLPDALEHAYPPDRLERLRPGALSLGALHHLIARNLGEAPVRPALSRIATATGGNPFFALEVARALRPTSKTGRLPTRYRCREAFRMRSQHESAGSRTPPGRSSSPPLRSRGRRSRRSRLRSGLRLTPTRGSPRQRRHECSVGTWTRRFHPSATGVDGLRVVDRRSSPQPARTPRRAVADREERARHLARSTTAPDEVVATELERAAAAAARNGAQDAAAELFEQAWRLTPPAAEEEIARRLLGQAAALVESDPASAQALADRAAERAETSPVRARALALAASIDWVQGDAETAIAKLENGLATRGSIASSAEH